MKKLLLTCLLFAVVTGVALAAEPTYITDWSTSDYTEAMINSGGADQNDFNNYWYSNVYMRTVEDGGETYTVFYVQLTEEQVSEIVDGSGSVKNSIYFSQGNGNAALVEEGDADFKYIYDDSGTRIIGFEARVNVEDLNITDTNFDYTSTSYYSSFAVQAVVNYDINNDGEIDNEETDLTSTNECRNPAGCDPPVCTTGDCSPGGGSEPGIPIDGGLGILAAIGLGFGVYSQRSKK